MTTIIKEIPYLETFSVRHPVLRAGKPIESCLFDGDDLITTHHFGLYLNEELVGIISLFLTKYLVFKEQKQYQIRGMAVLEQYQKSGFGKMLILYSEAFLNTQKVDLIWFNARVEAVGFYEKMGYQKTGKIFEIPDVGEHIVMFKKN